MHEQVLRANHFPVLFLDDWPAAPKSVHASGCRPNEDDFEPPGLNEIKRWRLQMLLAVNTWGIPSLALTEAYKRMFNRELDIKDLGYDDLASMISNLPEIFSIQEPDEITASMFPDYPCDRILHDARYGHHFNLTKNRNLNSSSLSSHSSSHSNLSGTFYGPSKQLAAIASEYNTQAASSSSSSLSSSISSPSSSFSSYLLHGTFNHGTTDPDTLNSYAWINRDEDLPPNVVLAGEDYTDLILPLSSANIPGTRGVYRAVIASVANPDRIFLNIKSDLLERLDQLSAEVTLFFSQCETPIAMYSIPNEFIYPGFPCLVRSSDTKVWERASIIKRSPKGNKVLVETVDYGGTITVNQIDLFLMPRRFFDFPRQALLVAVSGIQPILSDSQSRRSFDRRWSLEAGCRIRNFSDQKYWIDCLLLEAKETSNDDKIFLVANSNSNSSDSISTSISKSTTDENNNNYENSSSSSSSNSDGLEKTEIGDLETTSRPKKRKKALRKAEFEIIACDRNEQDCDLFMDEVLFLESYAVPDSVKLEEISTLKKQFQKALVSIPRPQNPLI